MFSFFIHYYLFIIYVLNLDNVCVCGFCEYINKHKSLIKWRCRAWKLMKVLTKMVAADKHSTSADWIRRNAPPLHALLLWIVCFRQQWWYGTYHEWKRKFTHIKNVIRKHMIECPTTTTTNISRVSFKFNQNVCHITFMCACVLISFFS